MTPDPAIFVRQAVVDDLDALVALEVATFESDRISRAQWRRHIASGSARVLVAGMRARIDAAAVVFYRRRSGCARLYSLAVAESARGCGLAGALLTVVEDDAVRRDCYALDLEVRTDNAAAIALYGHRGYRRAAHLPSFYEDGADAWRYTKSFGEPWHPKPP